MTLEEYVESIPNFDKLNHTDKVLAFAWYLAEYKSKDQFTASDIKLLFEEASVRLPSSIPPFLTSLHTRKPPALLKTNNRWKIERQTLSALKNKYSHRASTIAVHDLLRSMPRKINIDVERAYLEESIVCFKHGAFRASVVMTWNLAFDHVCQYILKQKRDEFNTQLIKSFPKSKPSSISTRDDLTTLKESEVLQVAKSSNIISGNVYKVLKEKLDRRNIAAHPSGIKITQLTAEEYITDLIENVVLKIKI